MDAESFDCILKVVSPIISKQELQKTRQINYCCNKDRQTKMFAT